MNKMVPLSFAEQPIFVWSHMCCNALASDIMIVAMGLGLRFIWMDVGIPVCRYITSQLNESGWREARLFLETV